MIYSIAWFVYLLWYIFDKTHLTMMIYLLLWFINMIRYIIQYRFINLIRCIIQYRFISMRRYFLFYDSFLFWDILGYKNSFPIYEISIPLIHLFMLIYSFIRFICSFRYNITLNSLWYYTTIIKVIAKSFLLAILFIY